jgi:hypothetical protein
MATYWSSLGNSIERNPNVIRRILLLLAVVTLMAAQLVASAMPAFAQGNDKGAFVEPQVECGLERVDESGSGNFQEGEGTLVFTPSGNLAGLCRHHPERDAGGPPAERGEGALVEHGCELELTDPFVPEPLIFEGKGNAVTTPSGNTNSSCLIPGLPDIL